MSLLISSEKSKYWEVVILLVVDTSFLEFYFLLESSNILFGNKYCQLFPMTKAARWLLHNHDIKYFSLNQSCTQYLGIRSALCVVPLPCCYVAVKNTVPTRLPQFGATVSNRAKAPQFYSSPHYFCIISVHDNIVKRHNVLASFWNSLGPWKGLSKFQRFTDYTLRTTWLKHPFDLAIRKGFTKWRVKIF